MIHESRSVAEGRLHLPGGDASPDAPIGAVMTPSAWARWVVARSSAVATLVAGGSVLEPTCGDGAILDALVEAAVDAGLEPGRALGRIWGVDREARLVEAARHRLQARWGVPMPRGRLVVSDILQWSPARRFDCVVGNPPWVTYADLPEHYKPAARRAFVELGLVADRRSVLLGASRADLATAVVHRVLTGLLARDGSATFLLPLSVFANDGANNRFRSLVAQANVALTELHDLSACDVFAGRAHTRCGVASFREGRETTWPVRLFRHSRDACEESSLVRVGELDSPLIESSAAMLPRVVVPPGSVPRQGVNTCGANAVYFVERLRERGDDVEIRDGTGRLHTVPRRFVYPVATPVEFVGARVPARWVVLPYEASTGRPLGTLDGTGLERFFAAHRERLVARKGRMLRSAIEAGRWWSMLGVGTYCFGPWKVMWEAYGRGHFNPRAFGMHDGQPWQANQALQAFLPVDDEVTASTIVRRLSDPSIEQWLRAHGTAGTMNWAQPGRIKRLLVPAS